MKLILIAVALVLAGCTTIPAATVTKVPVPVECKEKLADRPVMPTEEFKTKPTLDEFQRAARAEIERREGYEIKLRTALEACTAPIKPTNPETP